VKSELPRKRLSQVRGFIDELYVSIGVQMGALTHSVQVATMAEISGRFDSYWRHSWPFWPPHRTPRFFRNGSEGICSRYMAPLWLMHRK